MHPENNDQTRLICALHELRQAARILNALADFADSVASTHLDADGYETALGTIMTGLCPAEDAIARIQPPVSWDEPKAVVN